ncbi:MAG: response regulator transcription factor [Candidatus Limivicinus sp.]|jgi:two-component system response regulator YesN
MYRVVLIDDEQLIIEGLRKVVKWGDYDCKVIATADDAQSGALAIREYKPDIVFTDILMPGTDGLTMLAGLRSEFPDMLVTVLTGYRDFSYAQEAIKLGVHRFLLKPSKMDEINEALSSMKEILDKRSGVEEETQDDSKDHSAGSFIVNQAVSYMKDHYREKLSLQDVADCCYVSQWHLSKLLNKHAEMSFYDILNSIRVDAAKELMHDPKLKIGDIGCMVGYSDVAHFARTFKKIVGMSANEYRNTLS